MVLGYVRCAGSGCERVEAELGVSSLASAKDAGLALGMEAVAAASDTVADHGSLATAVEVDVVTDAEANAVFGVSVVL